MFDVGIVDLAVAAVREHRVTRQRECAVVVVVLVLQRHHRRGAQEVAHAPHELRDHGILRGRVGAQHRVDDQRAHPARRAERVIRPVSVVLRAVVVEAAIDVTRRARDLAVRAVLVPGEARDHGSDLVRVGGGAEEFVGDLHREQLEARVALGPETGRRRPGVVEAVVRGRDRGDAREGGLVAGQPVTVGEVLRVRVLGVAVTHVEMAGRSQVVAVELRRAHGLAQCVRESAAEIQHEHRRGAVVQPRLVAAAIGALVARAHARVVLVHEVVEVVLGRAVGFGIARPVLDAGIDRGIIARLGVRVVERKRGIALEHAERKPLLRQHRIDVRLLHAIGRDEAAARDRVPAVACRHRRGDVELARLAAPFDADRLRRAAGEGVTQLHARDAHRGAVERGIEPVPPRRHLAHVRGKLARALEHAQVRKARLRDRSARERHAERHELLGTGRHDLGRDQPHVERALADGRRDEGFDRDRRGAAREQQHPKKMFEVQGDALRYSRGRR